MLHRVERVDGTFTSAQAEQLTGAANARQRDWRRRGIWGVRQDRKHVRLSLQDLCELKVLSFLSSSGVSLDLMKALGKQAALSVHARLVRIQRAAATEPFKFTTQEFESACEAFGEGLLERYALLPMPEREEGSAVADCYFAHSLDTAYEKALADGAFPGALILDCWALADEIADAAEIPLFTIKAEEAGE